MNAARKLEIYNFNRMDAIPQLARLSEVERDAMRAVAAVLPFRVNRYVIDELIDWDRVPEDPMFRLTFPQRGMLAEPAPPRRSWPRPRARSRCA